MSQMNSGLYGYPMNAAATPMLKNPFSAGFAPLQNAGMLGLTQIEGYRPVEKFTDGGNAQWSLVKSYFDGSRDVPDPKSIQIVDFWDHKFLGVKDDVQLYVYVVEGVRQPRVETEQPCRVLYQWFSKAFVKDFNPGMITEREWLKANVYAAPMADARMSKLQAICRAGEAGAQAQPPADEALLKVEGLPNG